MSAKFCFVLVSAICLSAVQSSFAQVTQGTKVKAESIVRDWQRQYDQIKNESYLVQAERVNTILSTGESETSVLRFASTPDGKLYIRHTIGLMHEPRILAFNGKHLSVFVSEANLNRVFGHKNRAERFSAVYETNYGFAFHPSQIITNPALYSEATPADLGKRITEVRQLSQDSVEVTLRTTETDGVRIPSRVEFVRRGGSFAPKRFIYDLGESKVEAVLDDLKQFGKHFLPVKYRYIIQTNSLNEQYRSLSSVTTYTISYQTVIDTNIFELEPTPKQHIITVKEGDEPEGVAPIPAG